MLDWPGYANRPSCLGRGPPRPPLLIQMSTSSSLVKQRCILVDSRTPTSDVCASLWYPYQTGVLLAAAWSLKQSMTSLIAAVALATKTRSKCSGSAPKKRSARSRTTSTRWPAMAEGEDAECGLPYRFAIMSAENSSIKDLAYNCITCQPSHTHGTSFVQHTVVPPWSRYVLPFN